LKRTFRHLITYITLKNLYSRQNTGLQSDGLAVAIQQLTVQQLKQRLEENDNLFILDVREPWEYQICALSGSTLIPMGIVPLRFKELDQGKTIVVVCHHGIRSYQVARFLSGQGFDKLFNLQGGIDAWARQIDSTMETY